LFESTEAEQEGQPPSGILCQSEGFPDVVILLHRDVTLGEAVELTELLQKRVSGFRLEWPTDAVEPAPATASEEGGVAGLLVVGTTRATL
jgi:hypothetical protein